MSNHGTRKTLYSNVVIGGWLCDSPYGPDTKNKFMFEICIPSLIPSWCLVAPQTAILCYMGRPSFMIQVCSLEGHFSILCSVVKSKMKQSALREVHKSRTTHLQ